MKSVGEMRWQDLSFIHWRVPPQSLRPLVPPELELDTFEGSAFVGLVPFSNDRVKPKFLPPIPTANHFSEFNLRTYVRHREEPGVWFFSLDADSALAVLAARMGYALPYFAADMEVHRISDNILYTSHRRGLTRKHPGMEAHCLVGEPLGEATPGSLEHFLVERYVLFSKRRSHLFRCQVEHKPYFLHAAKVEIRREELRAAANIPRIGERTPDFYCRELHVKIGKLEAVTSKKDFFSNLLRLKSRFLVHD